MGDRMEELKGNLKEGAGKATGDQEMQSEGAAQHDTAKGAREIKGAANEAIGNVKEGLGKLVGDDQARGEGAGDKLKGNVQRAG